MNSTTVSAGGMEIQVIDYNIVIKSPHPIFTGTVAEMESMCEGHKKVCSALLLCVNLLKDGYVDADVSPTIKIAENALRIANIEL